MSNQSEPIKKYKRNGTKTSSFGTPGRINHDSTEFYNSKLYEDQKIPEHVKFIENPISSENLDKIYCKSSEVMSEIPDCGSGTACLSALKDGRHYIGYDIEPSYVKLANQRIKEHLKQLNIFENKQPT